VRVAPRLQSPHHPSPRGRVRNGQIAGTGEIRRSLQSGQAIGSAIPDDRRPSPFQVEDPLERSEKGEGLGRGSPRGCPSPTPPSDTG
jgi:hypothetical protein